MGKEERLKSRKLIERVFREGKSFALFPFRVYYIPLPVSGDSARTSVAGPIKGLSADPVAGLPAPVSSTPVIPMGTIPDVSADIPASIVPKDSPANPITRPLPRLQAGFGASSRNFKKAVDRNRIKRLSREAYRLQKQPLYEWLKEKDQALAVFIIYTGKELPNYEIVREKIGLALQKLMKNTGV